MNTWTTPVTMLLAIGVFVDMPAVRELAHTIGGPDKVYQVTEEDGCKGPGSHKGWSTTGQRLMQHCLPRKKLYITGKGGSTIAPITGDDLETVVAAGRFNPQKLSVPHLLEALGSWSVVVRQDAAEELGKREENVVEELIAMLDSPNRYARYGACIGLQYAGRESEEAVRALVDKLENSKSINMRYFSIAGLKWKPGAKNALGDVVKTAAPSLLKLAAVKQDPLGKLQQQIALTLLYSGRVSPFRGYFPEGHGMQALDSDLVVGAMKAWLTNPNGQGRTLASRVYDKLTPAQLEKLWGEVYYAAKNKAPSGVMFAGGGQSASTILLAENRFKEGLPLAVDYLTRDGWGKFGRVPAAFDALSYYGSAAKPYMKVMTLEHEDYQKRKTHEVKNENEKWARLMNNMTRISISEVLSPT